MKSRREFFNHAAGRWGRDRTVSDASYRRILEAARMEAHHRVLDVGSGTGVLLPFIAERIGEGVDIHAIDYAEAMIRELAAGDWPPNVRPAVMDIHSTGFADEQFDRVMANACYPHFERKDVALREIHRILRPDGLFILSHPTGREHVNAIHRRAHRTVCRDVLPEPHRLLELPQSCGFEATTVIDEPDFFLVVFQKNPSPPPAPLDSRPDGLL